MIRRLSIALTMAFAIASFSSQAVAGVEQLSEAEFSALATELAPKVNLFRYAWEQDPSAEFYGGTSRDYLYWLKGKFREADSRAAAEKVRAELRARSVIDIREFIIGDSDIDILSDKVHVKASDFGIKKIDVSNNALRKNTAEVLADEIKQGFIPAEKIRLSKQGFSQPKELGDGLGEIYRGRLSVKLPDAKEFSETRYAREGLNHPILLTLRFLRLQAMNYFQTYGAGAPDEKKLLAGIDADTQTRIRAISREVADGKALKPYLEKAKFREWMNGTIQKAFRSYTNPTAAHQLLKEFGFDSLPLAYGSAVEPINQYLFAKPRNPAQIQAALDKYGFSPADVYRPVSDFFPDGMLYHGTRSEEAFRNVIFQGVLESNGGSAGKGLYGVAAKDRDFSEAWGGDKNRLLGFPVRDDAKIIDITKGPGKSLWQAYHKAHSADYDAFADTFGADIVKYPYEREAYVVKNSASLGRARGIYREILPLTELFEALVKRPQDFFSLAEINRLSASELSHAAELAGVGTDRLIAEIRAGRSLHVVSALLSVRPKWKEDHAIHRAMLESGAFDREFADLLLSGQAEWKPEWVEAVLKRGSADDLLVKSPKLLELSGSDHIVRTLLGRISRCRLMLGFTSRCNGWEERASHLLRTLAKTDSGKRWKKEVGFLVDALKNRGKYTAVSDALLYSAYHEDLFRLAVSKGEAAERIRSHLQDNILYLKNEALALEYLERLPISPGEAFFLADEAVPLEAARPKLRALLAQADDTTILPIARVFFRRDWGADMAPMVGELLGKMKNFPEGFADRIFKSAKWSDEQKRAWIQKLVDEGRIEGGLLIDVLGNEPWVKETEWLDAILRRGQADDLFITFALNKQPDARPDWFRILLERGHRKVMMVYALEDPKWAAHPDLLFPFLESAHLSKDKKAALDRVLKAGHWRSNPTLLRLTGGQPPTVENLRLAIQGKGIAAIWKGVRSDCANLFLRLGR